MEKDRSARIIAVLALVFGIVGISLGFAAFDATLNITNTGASVNINEDDAFKIVFSSTSNSLTAGNAVVTPESGNGSNGSINNTGNPTVTGLSATFSGAGQSTVYKFYVLNEGDVKGFLKSISYNPASKTCTAGNGTTQTLVDTACGDITLTINAAGEEATGNKTDIKGKSVVKGTPQTVIVTIEYAAGHDLPDGDFTVTFGDISFEYGSVDNT